MPPQNEIILYKATPKSVIYTFIYVSVVGSIALFLFRTSIETQHILIFIILILLSFIRCFDSLIITPESIIFRQFFSKKSIDIKSLQNHPTLEIDPYIFKKYEWQRKILRQDFQNFWLNRSIVSFPISTQITNKTTLKNVRLSLFSKKQAENIQTVLEQHWRLSRTLHAPKQK